MKNMILPFIVRRIDLVWFKVEFNWLFTEVVCIEEGIISHQVHPQIFSNVLYFFLWLAIFGVIRSY
jgi:hypothetical protein